MNRWRAQHPNTAYLRDTSDAEDDYMYQNALGVPLDAIEQVARHRVSVSQALMCAEAASRVAVMKAGAAQKGLSKCWYRVIHLLV